MKPSMDLFTAQELTKTAYAHLVLGLMKADGRITLAENDRMKELLQTQPDGDAHGINFMEVYREVQNIILSDRYNGWEAEEHLHNAWDHLRHVARSGYCRKADMDHVSNILHELAQVDGFLRKEKRFLNQVYSSLEQLPVHP